MGKGKIKIAIVGVGNCASALVQGIEFYKKRLFSPSEEHIGLMNYNIGDYLPEDIEVVAAFDIDQRKVGHPLSEAIFAPPNCTTRFCPNVDDNGVIVSMGKALDGIAPHMNSYPQDNTFVLANHKNSDVEQLLADSGAEVLLNYLPVGSEEGVRYYAQCCLHTGVSLVNCMPVFIVSDDKWADKFEEKGIPIVGDDIKSQVGATVIHRTLAKLIEDRGAKIDRTYQLNTGGNTDFLNMLAKDRLKTKRISKTMSVQSVLKNQIPAENIHIGPSDYVAWQKDNKVCFIRIEGRKFGGVPFDLELRLSVEDSPNSAGVVIDVIRCCKLARDRGIGGVLTSIAAYAMKHPPLQFPDSEGKRMVQEFIEGNRER